MSIADKLTTIAENEQKVYDAGFAAGQAQGGSIINPEWKKWSYLCYGDRIEIAKALKYSDTSNGTHFQQMFANCQKISELPHIDTSNGTIFQGFCVHSVGIVSIPELNLSKATDLSNAFFGCSKLANIEFKGTIPIDISFQHSPLTKDSITNVVNALHPADVPVPVNITSLDSSGICFDIDTQSNLGNRLTFSVSAKLLIRDWESHDGVSDEVPEKTVDITVSGSDFVVDDTGSFTVSVILDGTEYSEVVWGNPSPFGSFYLYGGQLGPNIEIISGTITESNAEMIVKTGTATFNKAAKETAFTDDEWATLIATKPNWNIALV